MKKSGILFAAVLFAVGLMFAGVSHGQSNWNLGIPGGGEGGTISEAPAIVTVAGTVTKIEKMKGVKDGLQMRLKDDKGAMWVVYLGPKWFVDNQRIKFMPKDKVEVRGGKAIVEGNVRIIATEVSKGDWTMKLRNEDDGMPSWECCFPRQQMKEE